MQEIPGWVIGLLVFLFGLIIGSFLNVVIHRLPRRESLLFPGSRCPRCQTPIKPHHNIPLISYLMLRGRCHSCGAPISLVYPAVELLVGLLYLALYLVYGLTPAFAVNLVFVSFIVPLVFIDLAHKLLPDLLTYPGFVVVVVLRALVPYEPIQVHTRWLLDLQAWPDYGVALVAAGMGAIVGSGSFWLVRAVYYVVRRVEGMGLGDVKMMLMIGAFLGWQLTVVTIFVSTVFGSIIGITLAKLQGGSMKKTEIPFGAFLGPAAIVAMFVGQELIEWYMRQYR